MARNNTSLTLAEARRIALHAQGFGAPKKSSASGWAAQAKQLERLHLLQIDSVNVLTRSHYLPLFSRLGNYDRAALDKHTLAQTNRATFECWAHEASLVRMELHPLMRWRMNRAHKGDGIYRAMRDFARNEKAYLKNLLKFVASHGPTAQSDLPDKSKGQGGWWGWSKGKLALETLFAQGLLTTSKRESFERFYDLPENVIPSEILNLPTPNEREAMVQLMDLSGQALGVVDWKLERTPVVQFHVNATRFVPRRRGQGSARQESVARFCGLGESGFIDDRHGGFGGVHGFFSIRCKGGPSD